MKIDFDDEFLKEIYSELLPMVTNHVVSNSGSVSEAEDLFQEAVMTAYRKMLDDSFVLTLHPKTFIFAIAKRKWLDELRQRKQVSPLEVCMDVSDEEVESSIETYQRRQVFLKYFNELKGNCKKLPSQGKRSSAKMFK